MNDHRLANEYKGQRKFKFNQPRPPVPGEERVRHVADWAPAPPELPPKPEALGGAACLAAAPQKCDRAGDDTPPCIRWAQSLPNLLNDSDGVAQFMDYLEGEGPHHAAALRFWLACEGVRRQDQQDKAQQYAQAIYSIFVQSSFLPIGQELRSRISTILSSNDPLDIPVTIFDEAQLIVEKEINSTTYPNFLQSDIYLQCLQAVTPLSDEESGSPLSASENMEDAPRPLGSLPTLHENLEFFTKPPFAPYSHANTGFHTPNSVAPPLKLTKDTLLLSQQHRAADLRPQSEAYAGFFPYRNAGVHAAYNSYNPVSRQASEMQSLSSRSDVRTESDNMSLTDSSVDGISLGRTLRRKAALEAKRVKESALANRETHMQQTIIPRMQRTDARKAEPPRDPQQFARILIKKLETIRETDVGQELERRRKESESMSLPDDTRALANVLKEKLLLLQPEDDDDQDILDQHVSRVFSDLTPSRSGGASPTPRSRNAAVHPRPKRRDRDGFSTFSGDSGNVHDFQDGSEHRLSMVKSKSMSDYQEDRFVRASTARRSTSKKTLTDLTDSGVSVVSDTPPVLSSAVVNKTDNSRVLAWLEKSDRSSRCQSGTHSEVSGKYKSHRTSPISARHRSNKTFMTGSRSNSLERVGGACSIEGLPSQPFVLDTNMPPPAIPSTSNQLEEARRRLMDDKTRSKVRSSCKYYPDATLSGQSTLRKSVRGARPSMPCTGAVSPEEYTTVVFSYPDEQFPYRIRIPGSQVTFKQFKEYLPKKGNYRFFFKTICPDLDNQVIQEEVNRDNDVLPLCDGKVTALAKPVD